MWQNAVLRARQQCVPTTDVDADGSSACVLSAIEDHFFFANTAAVAAAALDDGSDEDLPARVTRRLCSRERRNKKHVHSCYTCATFAFSTEAQKGAAHL